MLLAEIIGFEHKTMGKLLKRDWKAVGMAKETMTDLIGRIQPVVTTLKKNSGNRSRTLSDIGKYWGQAFYNRFYNINKVLESDKFFRRLGTIVRQYKCSRIFIAFQAFSNTTTHGLLTVCHGVLSDHYCHQATNDFKKLLEQKDAKNTLKVATPILLTIGIHIGPTRLLKVGPPNA